MRKNYLRISEKILRKYKENILKILIKGEIPPFMGCDGKLREGTNIPNSHLGAYMRRSPNTPLALQCSVRRTDQGADQGADHREL